MKNNLDPLKSSIQFSKFLLFIFTLLTMTQCSNKLINPINLQAQKKCFSFIDENKFYDNNNSFMSNHDKLYINGFLNDNLKYDNDMVYIYSKERNNSNSFDLELGWSKETKRIKVTSFAEMQIDGYELKYKGDKYRINQNYINRTTLPTLKLVDNSNNSKIWLSFSPPFLLFSQHLEMQAVNKENLNGTQEYYYYEAIKKTFEKYDNPQRLFVVNQKSLTELIELIPNNSREKIKKELAIDSDFTNHFLSYLNNNKIEFDYLMQETEILSSAFYSSYITNICDEKLKVTFLLNSCNKINYNEWEKILKKNPSLITELGNTIKNKYPKEFLNDKQVSYISNFYISNNEPLVIGNELKYKSLTNEIIENSLRWMLPNVIEIISDNDDRDLALKRYINLSKDMNDIVDAKKLYPEMTSYASKKSSEFVSSISDKKIYLKIFPKGFHSEKYNQEIYAYEQELEKQRQQRIQRRIERRNNFLFVDQLKQMFHDEVEPLFILSKLKQISNEYPVDLSEIQLNILKHVRFVTQTKTAQNSQSGGIASFMSGGISGALSHKSNVGSVYENELIWVINPNQSVGGFDDYISPIDNPKTLVSNIFYEIENNRYERWSRRIMHSNFGEYNKPVKVPAYARSRGESLSSGWYIMGALTGAYVTYTKGLQYLGSKGYLSSESSSSGYSNESTTSNRNNSNESTSSYSREKIDKSNNSNNNNEPQIIKDGTKKYGQYESVLYKIICPDGYTNYLYYDEQSKCWHKRSSATCDYLTPNTKEGLRRAARKLCGNN